MEQENDAMHLLDLIDRPAFSVQNNRIVYANAPAQHRQITVDTDLNALLAGNQSIYAAFSGGELHLTLVFSGSTSGASVTRISGYDIFVLDPPYEYSELQSLALAAQHLRAPLANVMAISDQLFSNSALQASPQMLEQAGQITRSLYQLYRITGNMTDTGLYRTVSSARMETVDICSVFSEIIEKINTRLSATGITLTFISPKKMIFCRADREMLERATLNLVSNAVKFSDKGSHIEAKLTQTDSHVCFTLQNSGTHIAPDLMGTLFTRFLREPSIEDGDHGIGLGMALVRSIAAAHGGTVLIDQPDCRSTRVTMTLAIQQNKHETVRSPIMRIGDYAGGRDHGLLELSEIIPSASFEPTDTK